MKKNKLTAYQKIVRAAEAGQGVRLAYSDIAEMLVDPAITDAADNDCVSQGRCRRCWRVRCICVA